VCLGWVLHAAGAVAAERPLPEPMAQTAWLAPLQAVQPLSLAQAQPLKLETLLRHVLASSPELALVKEQRQEKVLRFRRVAAKRLLFVFKYLNASDLEGSASLDIAASEAQLERTQNTVLLQASQQYYGLVKAYLQQQVAYHSLQQGLAQWRSNQACFASGQCRSFELLETQSELLNRYQQHQQAQSQVALANQTLSDWLVSSSPGAASAVPPLLWRPEHLPTLVLPGLGTTGALVSTALPPSWAQPAVTQPVEALLNQAMTNRADIKELALKIASTQKLLKAQAFEFNNNQGAFITSSLQQLVWKQQILHRQVQWEVRDAYRQNQAAQEAGQTTQHQLVLAQRYWQQRQRSAQAGFASNKEVLDAQVLLANAFLAAFSAGAEEHLAQLRLLCAVGTLHTVLASQSTSQPTSHSTSQGA
jgi:outer membrane protein TolC